MSVENPSHHSVLMNAIEEIRAITETMQSDPSFSSLCHDAQTRIAKRIQTDPLEFVMHTMQTVENGLGQDDPLMSEANLLLNLAFKVASEYCANHLIVSKISHCISAMGTKDALEVRKKVLEVLGDE